MRVLLMCLVGAGCAIPRGAPVRDIDMEIPVFVENFTGETVRVRFAGADGRDLMLGSIQQAGRTALSRALPRYALPGTLTVEMVGVPGKVPLYGTIKTVPKGSGIVVRVFQRLEGSQWEIQFISPS